MTFLGTAVYFAAYIPYFSWMATPLFQLLRGNKDQKNGPIEWTDKHQKCFETIKAALISAPVRGHPEAGRPYRLYTDASDFAIAGTRSSSRVWTQACLSVVHSRAAAKPSSKARFEERSREWDDDSGTMVYFKVPESTSANSALMMRSSASENIA